MLGKKIHAFLAAQNQLTNVARPSLDEVGGMWVSYPKSMTTQPSDADLAHSSFRYFGRGNYGHVQAVDPHTRIMDVVFLYNRVEGETDTRKSGAQFEVVKLPYDHPVLEFYTHEVPAPPQLGYLVSYTSGAEHHWLPSQALNGRPERIEDALGYKVGVKETESDQPGPHDAIYPGRVVGFDRAKATVCVLFDASDPSAEHDQEDVPWQSGDLQWLMPPAASRPKTLEEAVGYNVEVNRAVGEELAHRAARGTVISVRSTDNTVRVVYTPPEGQTFATEAEYIPFESTRISWLNKISLHNLPTSPRPSGPVVSKLVETARPQDILSTVGHMVEVRAVGPDAEAGDMYSGMVIAADSAAGTVRVLYDGAEKSRTTAVGEEEDGEDCEDFPWTSPDIVWVVEDPLLAAARPNSAVRRPKALVDAVGKQVDVLSREDDAQEGDYYSGVVVSVDNEKQTMRVVFHGHDDNQDDYEDLPWHSPDVFWLSDESVQARDRRPSVRSGVERAEEHQDDAHSVGNSSIASLLTVRPRSLADATQWRVKVGAELLGGSVVAVEAATECLWIVFNAVPDAPAPVQMKVHWRSPTLEWLKEGTAAAAASSPDKAPTDSSAPAGARKRPASLAAAVGWAVEVRAEDAEDEVFVGQVTAADPATGLLRVLFAGEDGSLQEDDAEFFPLDSRLLSWITAPAGSQAAVPSGDAAGQEGHPEGTAATGAAGTPPALQAAVDRAVNAVLAFVPGRVTSVSQALQTVNLQLDGDHAATEAETAGGEAGEAATLLVGVPFSSSIIEWDCKL
jgi:hypothetical protein